jgi:HEAT repeat protein
MALKKKNSDELRPTDQRQQPRDREGLLKQLDDTDHERRRWAALDLADYPETVERLCRQLEQETEWMVCEAILTSLSRIGGNAAVKGLLPLLRSEDALLRNSVIEVLQQLPESLSPYIEQMLKDASSDYRIFTIDVLRDLRHPHAPIWLKEVIEQDRHINVCAAAVELLGEIGTPEMIPILKALPQRFLNDPFIQFSVDVAIRRIQGGE